MKHQEVSGAANKPDNLHFDQLPTSDIVQAFGVEYAHIPCEGGGDLYLTRFGWPMRDQLKPENWFYDQWYVKEGEKLAGATGSVYHVQTKPVAGRQADLLVKFSRVAQEVPLMIATTFPEDVSPEIIAAARFNSPMEEFGLLSELRRGLVGPPDVKIRTQTPLGIYTPPKEYKLWQLGRETSRFHVHRRLLAADQEFSVKAIELDIKRIYVMLYGWVKGRDAHELWADGKLSDKEFFDLTPRVIGELKSKGFRVLDNKPKHFILRERKKDGTMLKRDRKELTYTLIDFELLQRTPEYQKQFKESRRQQYHSAISRSRTIDAPVTPTHLKPVDIFGVKYLFGRAQDGGLLWVVGDNPILYDFFIPERWRRTPRVKLSSQNETYRTRSRDNVNIVYRRSRVGSLPRVDPLTGEGKRIREYGYNSPFEEVVIAQRLNQMGIPTTSPRAVYRTAHHSTKAAYLQDNRRIEDHAEIITPDSFKESILVRDYDYYTIWDHFAGVEPELTSSPGRYLELEDALVSGAVTNDEYNSIIERAKSMLKRFKMTNERLEDYEFMLKLNDDGTVYRDRLGALTALFTLDALTAYEIGFINEELYKRTIGELQTKLRAADCEKLDLKGSHLLLSINPDGHIVKDRDGSLRVALCNFEFIKGLYRPIR